MKNQSKEAFLHLLAIGRQVLRQGNEELSVRSQENEDFNRMNGQYPANCFQFMEICGTSVITMAADISFNDRPAARQQSSGVLKCLLD
jgi:hypothetical protein